MVLEYTMQLTINYTLTSVFLALGICVLLLAGDFSAMNMILGSIEAEFSIGLVKVQWVIVAYLLGFFMFIVPSGRLADLFGRKRIFLIGLLVFAAASIGGASASSLELLMVARLFQGLGAALIWPSIIGICHDAVPLEKESFAIALLLGIAGFGLAIAAPLGGLVDKYLGWRGILWINAPLALLSGLFASFYTEKQKLLKKEDSIDILGFVTLILGLVAFLFAMERGDVWGFFSWKTLSLLIVAILFIILFLVIENSRKSPMVPPGLLKHKPYMMAVAVMALIAPAFFTELLYLPEYMQLFLGYTSMDAGFALMPMFIVWGLISPIAGDLYNHMGAKVTLMIATASIALGALLFGIVGAQASYYFLLPGMIISGIGYGFGFSAITSAAIDAVDENKTSLAAGLLYMLMIAGGILGLVIGTEIFTGVGYLVLWGDIKHALSELQHQVLQGFLMRTQALFKAVSDVSPSSDGLLLKAYTLGFLATMIFNALLALSATFLATFFIKKRKQEL